MEKLRTIAVIPARYASTRLPGKPLCDILGKPMIQHTYQACKRAKLLNRIVVATDDSRIYDAVKSFGGEAVMTNADCATGTDRIIQSLESIADEYDIVVNVQGDEPCINPEHIDAVTQCLASDPSAVMGTVATRLHSESEAYDRNVVKCVVNQKMDAIYFSRALIPHSKSGKFDPQYPYLRHLGLYAFRWDFLKVYSNLQTKSLENQEELEQLRVLEAGYPIKVAIVSGAVPGVDTPEGLEFIRKHLSEANREELTAENK